VIIIYPSYQLAHPFLFTISLNLGLVLCLLILFDGQGCWRIGWSWS